MNDTPSQPGAMRALVAIDGSEAASRAVDLVCGIRWPAGTVIVVAEAVESGEGLYGGPWPSLAMVEVGRLETEVRSSAEQDVSEAAERLVRPGLTVETAVLRGRPATAISERARVMGADLIVVGSRGHGRIVPMLLGSISSELVDHAPAPVLVVRGTSIDRVMLAWDGSSCAARAAGLLPTWPIFAGSSIRVVSVADIEVPWWTGFPEPGSPEMMPIFVETAEASRRHHDELVIDMTDTLRAAGLRATGDRPEGDAATELLARARATNTDLIVLGTHGRTGLARLVIGSVARNVLHHATCSVLIVREPHAHPKSPESGHATPTSTER
jgi:nucleotide-binding universal stress UspA family protein